MVAAAADTAKNGLRRKSDEGPGILGLFLFLLHMTALCFPPFSTARLALMLTVDDELFIAPALQGVGR
jgi:hypothetical protein